MQSVSLTGLIRLVYGDAVRVLQAMPQLALTAFLIGYAHSLARLILVTPGSPFAGRGAGLLMLLAGLAWVFLLVPLLIAVHRFIILDEVTRDYVIEPKSSRVLRFFGSWIALSVVAAIPLLLILSVAALVVIGRSIDSWFVWGMLIAVLIVSIMLSLRMTILFPAIATDAPGATWTRAYNDTRGQTFGIGMIFVFVIVPFLALALLAAAVAWLIVIFGVVALAMIVPVKAASVLVTLASFAIYNALYLATVVLLATLASRLYQLLGNQVKPPPSVPHAA